MKFVLTASILAALAYGGIVPRQDDDCHPRNVTLSNLLWKNYTHNLDCANQTPETENLCLTGKNPQPAGYAPPDSFTVDVLPYRSCWQVNPGSVPIRDIGDDYVRCGNSEPFLYFRGDSNTDGITEAWAQVQLSLTCNGTVRGLRGSTTFPLNCSHDEYFNATCTAESFPLLLWEVL